jgi:hypothetical protein
VRRCPEKRSRSLRLCILTCLVGADSMLPGLED